MISLFKSSASHRKIILISLAVAALVFVLWRAFRGASTEEIAGTYVYKYRGGEVEELTLNADLTAHQALYQTAADFIASQKALYTHDGPWVHMGDDIGLEVYDFMDVLTSSLKLPPSLIQYRTAPSGSLGWASSWCEIRSPVLLRGEDVGDIMQRVVSRKDIEKCVWTYPSK